MTTTAKLRAALEMCERATGGPWNASSHKEGAIPVGEVCRVDDRGWHAVVSEHVEYGAADGPQCAADVEFIAVARTGYPAALRLLIEVLEMAEGLVEPVPLSVQCKSTGDELREDNVLEEVGREILAIIDKGEM